MRWNDTGLSGQRVPVPPEDTLSAEAAAHAERMQDHLASAIRAAGGWISFERYMDLALYAPGLGYYSAGASKLGAAGDFITAPEVSRLFGACVAQQCFEVLSDLPRGDILEIGAGTGRLAVDVLRRLETLGGLPERYVILEISADLRARQHALLLSHLPHLASRIEWLDAPPDAAFDGVILANEVLDALPVVRFRYARERCDELGVSLTGQRLDWSARPAGTEVSGRCERLALQADWDDGYVSEFCPRLESLIAAVVGSLRRGAALWFDYGLPRAQYYLAERHEGTLLCHFRHRVLDDPFRYPGLQDITAWVDFTALAEACDAAGCAVAGFTTQAYFLAGLGIDREMHLLAQDDANRFAHLANQARQLMLPGEMGERFKVMACTRGIARPLSGFVLQDLRHTL